MPQDPSASGMFRLDDAQFADAMFRTVPSDLQLFVLRNFEARQTPSRLQIDPVASPVPSPLRPALCHRLSVLNPSCTAQTLMYSDTFLKLSPTAMCVLFASGVQADEFLLFQVR